MAWYDLKTNELVADYDAEDYISEVWTMDEHKRYLKECGIDVVNYSKTDIRCSYVDLLDSYHKDMNRDHDLAKQWGLGYAEIRCNHCMRYFEDENDLMEMEDNGEWIMACPDCMTDEYLMDLE